MERFWSKVEKGDACWLWTAGVKSSGYGAFSMEGRAGGMKPAHRVAWELTNGHIPVGLDVCHTCDVRLCVNPAHLFLGTRLDNMRDAARKGRVVKGNTHHATKLTPEQVKEIRLKYGAGGTSYGKLAGDYAVTSWCIRDVVKFRTHSS